MSGVKRRLIGEGDATPSVAAAAFTVTCSEASRPARSGDSAEGQHHSAAQQVEPESQDPCTLFLQRFRVALQVARAGMDTALDGADSSVEVLIGQSAESFQFLSAMVIDAQAANKNARELLAVKRHEATQALQLLMAEDEA